MLAVQTKPEKVTGEELKNAAKPRDIIVARHKKVTSYNDNGDEITKTQISYVNISKKVNESKKLIKTDSAAEKLAQLEKIFTKKEN